MLNKIKDLISGKAPISSGRSSKWPSVRKKFLSVFPRCASCGGSSKVEVHHIVPFHLNPALELDFDNLITLCESKKYGLNCHLFVGHRGNYRDANPECKRTAITVASYYQIKL
jgi:hypothetical protein